MKKFTAFCGLFCFIPYIYICNFILENCFSFGGWKKGIFFIGNGVDIKGIKNPELMGEDCKYSPAAYPHQLGGTILRLVCPFLVSFYFIFRFGGLIYLS